MCLLRLTLSEMAAVQQLGFAVSGSKQPRWLELRQEAERILADVYVRREAEAR